MTKEEEDLMYKELSEYNAEVAKHNDDIIKSFGEKAKKDFDRLTDCCEISEKITIVDNPKGDKQNNGFGIFKDVYIDQRSIGLEGDSFEGEIYTKVKDVWYCLPFYC
jgi:hypothetical protein